jgi:hypothetical protein
MQWSRNSGTTVSAMWTNFSRAFFSSQGRRRLAKASLMREVVVAVVLDPAQARFAEERPREDPLAEVVDHADAVVELQPHARRERHVEVERVRAEAFGLHVVLEHGDGEVVVSHAAPGHDDQRDPRRLDGARRA